jgi:hypothetical protein
MSSDEDMLCFYASSADKPAGKGANEYVSDASVYAELDSITHWRRMFSSLFVFMNGEKLVWRGRSYRSHSHAYQAAKFTTAGHDETAMLFSIESDSELGTYGSGLDAHRARKIINLSPQELALWYDEESQCKDEIYAAKYSIPSVQKALLATGTAQLWNRGPRIRILRNTRLEAIRTMLAAMQ